MRPVLNWPICVYYFNILYMERRVALTNVNVYSYIMYKPLNCRSLMDPPELIHVRETIM